MNNYNKRTVANDIAMMVKRMELRYQFMENMKCKNIGKSENAKSKKRGKKK